ncbi:hypothetical protein LTR84_001419 [Exophiala bonariae]|uniref:Hypervirulence associated protein TUDOR domain-containing protein n=1 Tax=Exophiala bonariae TaxID=1690606 RepID=A0AAV9NG30_9EURO|nr:hypothetical protein LTR84_001419 [Exophiala bonariae]
MEITKSGHRRGDTLLGKARDVGSYHGERNRDRAWVRPKYQEPEDSTAVVGTKLDQKSSRETLCDVSIETLSHVGAEMHEPHCAYGSTRNATNVLITRAEISCSDSEETVDATESDGEEIRLEDIEAKTHENNVSEL